MKELSVIRDSWALVRERRTRWLLPIVIVLMVGGALLLLAEFALLAPHVYTGF